MLDAALSMGRLCDTLDAVREDNVERAKYELWLHRIWDRTYEDFAKQVEAASKPKSKLSEKRQIDIINQSLAIAGFSFAGGGE